MNARHWTRHFEANRDHYPEPDWDSPCELADPTARRLLAGSLAIFQLGESGGGTRLLRFISQYAGLKQKDYETATRLFVAEEQGHARLLSHLVRRLDGQLLRKHWINSTFRGVRAVLGLEFNIQILLTAELIAEAYYGALHDTVEEPVVRQVCGRILRDEIYHIRFHRDFLRKVHAARLPLASHLWALQFQAVYLVTEFLVWRDHGSCLAHFGTSTTAFRARGRGACRRFLQGLLSRATPSSPRGLSRDRIASLR